MRVALSSAFALLGLFQLGVSSKSEHELTAPADAPSVRLHVIMKREKMRFHGTLSYDVYATPVMSANGTNVLYEGYATFHDKGSEVTYTLANGVAYLTTKDAGGIETVECLSHDALPFSEILPALNAVSRIPGASIGEEAVKCPSGPLFRTSFAGTQYAVCVSGQAGFTAFSSDLDIVVEYLDRQERIPAPKLTDGKSSCTPVAQATPMTSTALALMRGRELPSSGTRMLKAAAHMAMQATECQPASKPRPCIFFHGLGNPKEAPELQDTPAMVHDMIGDMHGHAPFCSTIKYAIIDTETAGWTDKVLHKKFCKFALSMSPTSNVTEGVIDSTIIVTHSMGGLVMAAALATGRCKFSRKTSWVALSPPMGGSMASDFMMGVCEKDGTVAENLFGLIGHCPMTVCRKSTIYQGEKYSTPSTNKAYAAAQKAYRRNVAAAMCSDSPLGLFSPYQVRSAIGGKILPHKSEENDGLVEYKSCAAGLDVAKFGNHYLDRFYRPQLNHADTALLNGDGVLKNSQKPVKWFQCLAL
ncbi:unnamed protein product [Hyaloperonospora brassicae]|uniref:GPI inositol-deacylase n=1 Tax=Hyaloperonospora brassicae TaxID=162125 RepID=A0AAV0UX33_HYABA|nr:unnamed protein product [Hyaloperonospora brassicae]